MSLYYYSTDNDHIPTNSSLSKYNCFICDRSITPSTKETICIQQDTYVCWHLCNEACLNIWILTDVNIANGRTKLKEKK